MLVGFDCNSAGEESGYPSCTSHKKNVFYNRIKGEKVNISEEDVGRTHKVVDDLFGINPKDLNNNFYSTHNKNLSGGEKVFNNYVQRMNILLGSYDPFMAVYRLNGVGVNA